LFYKGIIGLKLEVITNYFLQMVTMLWFFITNYVVICILENFFQ
jgi:hypothetical protein